MNQFPPSATDAPESTPDGYGAVALVLTASVDVFVLHALYTAE